MEYLGKTTVKQKRHSKTQKENCYPCLFHNSKKEGIVYFLDVLQLRPES